MKISPMHSVIVALGIGLVAAAPRAQTGGTFDLRVEETAGIRRNNYPAGTRLHFLKGVLSDTTHARLLANGQEVPAQVGVESSYPDGSVQWLTVDFNASVGPHERLPFKFEYGEAIKAAVMRCDSQLRSP